MVVSPNTRLSKTVLKDRVVKILDESGRGLAVAVTIPQHKLIADVAAAQEIFATRQRLGEDVIGYAHALKIEALAGLGELIAKAPKAPSARGRKGGGTRGSKKDPQVNTPPTLAEQGVDKKTANLARKLSGLSGTERNAVAARDKTLAQVTREKTAAVRATRLALPDAKYRVIYADPPWKYNDTADAGSVQAGGAEKKYPVMSIAESRPPGTPGTRRLEPRPFRPSPVVPLAPAAGAESDRLAPAAGVGAIVLGA